MRRLGIEFTEDRFYALGGIPSDKIIQILSGEMNLSVDAIAVAREKEQAFLDSMHLLVEIQLITSVVRENKGKLPMSVASGGFRDIVEKLVAHIGLEGWFDAMVTAEDITRHKPEPDFFLEAARRAGMPWGDVRTLHRPRRITAYEVPGVMAIRIDNIQCPR